MKEISLKENINTIQEISPGRFRIILDFATIGIVKYLLQDDYKYVWVHNHILRNSVEWTELELPILPLRRPQRILARNVRFDFILTTPEFKDILDDWQRGITMIQLNKLPPYYLELDRINGDNRYQLLKEECDFLFELDIQSATDYGVLISNNRKYLQSVLDNPNINWKELP